MAVVGSAEFQVRADRAQMKKDLEAAKRDLAGFTSDAEHEVGGSTGRISGLIGKIGFAVTALTAVVGAGIAIALKFGGASLEMAETIADSAKRIGIGTEALQEFQYVARKTGQDASAVGSDLEAFSNKAAQAMAGLSKESADAFRALGFKPDDLKKFKDTETLLDAVLDRIGELSSESDRAAITEKLGLGSLATAAREGSDEIARLRDEARELGLVMDDALIQKGADAKEKLEDLSQVIGVQMASAFLDLSDEVIAFTGWIAGALKALNDFTAGYSNWKQNTDLINGKGFTDQLLWGDAGKALQQGWGNQVNGNAERMRNAIDHPNYENSDDPALQRQAMAVAAFGSGPAQPNRTPRTSLTPVQPRGRTDNSAQRKAEQEARRAERVETEINRARAEMLGIVDDELQTVQQRYDTAKAQTAAEREAEKTQLESRKARKDITQGEFDQLTLINRQTANLEDRVAADVLARDLADERMAQERLISDLTNDLLTLQSGAARTARDRLTIEQTLLGRAQERAREDLEIKLARTPGLSDSAKDQARATLNGVQVGQRDALQRQNMSPLDAWRDQSLKTAGEIGEAYENIAANGLDALNDGLVDAILNSKNLGDVFSNVAKQILADLLKISVRQSITEPLAKMLFGGGSSGASSGGGGMGNFLFNLFKIGRNANGTSSWGGGLTSINEGMMGEIVNLPNGTQIIPHDISKRMAEGAGGARAAGPTFVLHSPVMTQDLLDQMNAIGADSERRSNQWAATNVPGLAQSQTAKQQQHAVGRRRR